MIYTNEIIKKRNIKKQNWEKFLKFIYIPLIILVFSIILSIFIQKYFLKKDTCKIFGFQFYTVLTGSMEPNYEIGDLIIGRSVNPNQISENDIITFSVDEFDNTVTHRVIEVVKENGKTMYRTKGDNNNAPDSELVDYSQIKGRIVFRINKLGSIIAKLLSGVGICLITIFIILSYIKTCRSEEKRIAREDARRRFNIPKYKKENA